MSKVQFKAIPKKFENGSYLLLPATPVDRLSLNGFCENIGQNYITVTVSRNRGTKSYNQVKTIFALIKIRFYLNKRRYPTDTEQAKEYSDLLWKYADREPVINGSEETAPITLSAMSKSQAAMFISAIIAEVYEYMGNGLNDSMEIELKEVFEEFQAANGQGVGNPTDYDKNENLLSEEEWRRKNHFSFASGVSDETLQLHHILSRGSHPEFEDKPWNWIMLTDYEHNRIIHAKGGWQKFLELFPHCAPRIKNAYDMAHEMYPHEIQVSLIKLGLIDELSNDIKPEEGTSAENPQNLELNFENMKPTDLAASALEEVYKGDIY